jgi:ABC-2 type transport system permease protein
MPETPVTTGASPVSLNGSGGTSVAEAETPSYVYAYDSNRRQSVYLTELQALLSYRDLVMQLVSRNIKTRYKRSVLGVAWTMISPLMMMSVLAIVFSSLFSSRIEHYAVFLLTGITFWNFFSQTSAGIMTELNWGGSLLTKIYVPPSAFAISALGTGLVNLVLALVPLLLIMAATGTAITPALLFLPVAILLTSMFTLGVGLVLARLAVFFADVVEMYQIVLMVWFYATPIIYPLEIVSEERRLLLMLNPVYYLLELFRAPVYLGRLPDLETMTIAGIISTTTLLVGWWYFTKKVDEFAYRV